jgi:hypothetical protein
MDCRQKVVDSKTLLYTTSNIPLYSVFVIDYRVATIHEINCRVGVGATSFLERVAEDYKISKNPCLFPLEIIKPLFHLDTANSCSNWIVNSEPQLL